MKKLIPILAVAVAALSVSAQTRYFIVGGFNGWNAAGNELVDNGDGTFVATIASLTPEFKVTENGNWRPVWYPEAGNTALTLGQPLTLVRDEVNDGPNIVFADPDCRQVDNAKVVFNPTAKTITVIGTVAMPDLYVTGSMTGWGYPGDTDGHSIKMDFDGTSVFTATLNIVNNPADPTRFRICPYHSWAGFGLPDGAEPLTAPCEGVVLNDNDSKEVFLNVADGLYDIAFDYSTKELSIKANGATPPVIVKDYYITGSMTWWDTPGGSGTYKLTALDDGSYSCVLNVYNSPTQDTRFVIGEYGSWSCWGLPKGAQAVKADGVEVDIVNPESEKQDILIDVPNGPYTVVFNPTTLKLSLTPYQTDVDPAKIAMFTGNSITDFWDNTHPLFFADNLISNTGHSGETSRQILERFDNDVLSQNPYIVAIIAPVTNDIAENEGPVTDDQMIANVRAMIEKAKANGAKVILANGVPSNYFFWRPDMRPAQHIIELNRRMAILADEMNVLLVDLHSAMADSEGALPSQYGDDGCHPNSGGYDVMESLMLPAVEQLRQADDDSEDALQTIVAESFSMPVYYDLQGRRILSPTHGSIIISIVDGLSSKVRF